MTNAHSAREWLQPHSRAKSERSPATSSLYRPTPEVTKFGIDTANMFGFWDWVGGCYSMIGDHFPL
jgi:glucose-6-phosphate isomerase